MTPLRQRMISELQLQRKSPHTVRAYLRSVKQLAGYYNRSPDQISLTEVREFFRHLIHDQKLAFSSVNVKLAGINFFYIQVLGLSKFELRIPSKGRKNLPVPLSQDEVRRLFEATPNLRHRLMLMTTYAAGLRVSEVVKLKITDIQSDRMMILVRQGKGGKDRYTLLSKQLLEYLRQYWRQHRPHDWLFVNRDREPMSVSSLQSIFNKAKANAGITRGRGIHCLRHSFATHLLESGIDLTIIAKLLGHRNLSTTSVYLHVTRRHIASINSPLDLLPDPNQAAPGSGPHKQSPSDR